MANVQEWFKGIGFALFGAFAFYFLWDNVFLGIINFIGSFAISGITESTSISILKTMAWFNLIVLYIAVIPGYLLYSIMGTGYGRKTNPLTMWKGVGLWCVLFPVMVVIYVIVASISGALSTSVATLADAGSVTMATNMTWLITLIAFIGLNFLPFYYILKGYGVMEVPNET